MTNLKLFPLTKLFPSLPHTYSNGYFVDKDGYIWSTRQGAARKMALQTPGLEKTSYTCINAPAGRGKTSTLSIKRFTILHALNSSKEAQHFFADTHVPKVHAKGYVVGTLSTTGISFAISPKIHDTLQSARTETERLAKTFPGNKYAYLEIQGICVAGELTWS